jgi:hypothetical protein
MTKYNINPQSFKTSFSVSNDEYDLIEVDLNLLHAQIVGDNKEIKDGMQNEETKDQGEEIQEGKESKEGKEVK